MNLTEALKIPRVWWVVLKGHHYGPDSMPTKVEVVEIHERDKQSEVILNGRRMRLSYIFDNWNAYDNFWLAWAAVRRSKE